MMIGDSKFLQFPDVYNNFLLIIMITAFYVAYFSNVFQAEFHTTLTLLGKETNYRQIGRYHNNWFNFAMNPSVSGICNCEPNTLAKMLEMQGRLEKTLKSCPVGWTSFHSANLLIEVVLPGGWRRIWILNIMHTKYPFVWISSITGKSNYEEA